MRMFSYLQGQLSGLTSLRYRTNVTPNLVRSNVFLHIQIFEKIELLRIRIILENRVVAVLEDMLEGIYVHCGEVENYFIPCRVAFPSKHRYVLARLSA